MYTYWILMDNAWQTQWGLSMAPALEQPQLWTRPYVHSFAAYDNIQLAPGSDEALIADDIAREWGKVLPLLLRAKSESEFNTLWADFQKFRIQKGIAKIQAKQTEILKLNKSKLGMN
jgi:putative aldouronate transport system substrate-binding protein